MPVSSAPTTVNDENAHPAERSSPFSPSVCAPLQLGSAFRGRALAPDSNLNTNSPDLFNNSTKRRSTTGDLLASMLGSSSHWDDLAAQQRTVFGLASPTKLERRSLSQTSPSKKSMFFDNTNVQVNKTASGTVLPSHTFSLQSPFAPLDAGDNIPPLQRIQGLCGTPDVPRAQLPVQVETPPAVCPALPRAPDSMPRFPTPGISPSSSWSPSDNLGRASPANSRWPQRSHRTNSSTSSLRYAVLTAETPPSAPPQLARVPGSMPRFPTPCHTAVDSPSPSPRKKQTPQTALSQDDAAEHQLHYPSLFSQKGQTARPRSLQYLPEEVWKVSPDRMPLRRIQSVASLESLDSPQAKNTTLKLMDDETNRTTTLGLGLQDDALQVDRVDEQGSTFFSRPTSTSDTEEQQTSSFGQQSPAPELDRTRNEYSEPPPPSSIKDATLLVPDGDAVNDASSLPSPVVQSSGFSSDDQETSSRGRDLQRKSLFGIKLASKSGRSRSKSARPAVESRPSSPATGLPSPGDDLQSTRQRRNSLSHRISGLLTKNKKKASSSIEQQSASVPPTPALPDAFVAETHNTTETEVAKVTKKPQLRSRASAIFNKRLNRSSSSPNLRGAHAQQGAGLGISLKPESEFPPPPPPLPSPSMLSAGVFGSLQIATAPLGGRFLASPHPSPASEPTVSPTIHSFDFGMPSRQADGKDPLQSSTATSPSEDSGATHLSERSLLFDSAQCASTDTSMEPTPLLQDNSQDASYMDDKCEILKREDSVPTEEEGCRVWPPPVSDLSQSEYSGTIESSLSLQLHQESSLINEDFVWHLATLQDGEEDPRSRGSARFDPQQGSSYGGDYQHPADRDASQAIQSGAFNLQQQRSPGSDSESDSSSDGFGLPVAAGSEDESDSESESDEDVPLAQRHPGALQAQRSLRDKARKDRKEKKAKARKAKEDAAARKPFQFESVMMSTKPLDKRVPHIGEKAVKRSSTPQPTLEGHSLLPQTDESVRKRTLSRTQGRPRDLVLPPLEHSVLIHTEAAYMPGLNAESAVNQTLQSTSLGRSATTAHPHKQSIKVKPTRSNTLPTSQPEPSGSEGVDVGISATVYLKTLDGSRTVHNATDANSVLRYILERGWLSDQMQTIAVWEVWTQLGIERPLRPDESIKALMDSWDTTSKAVLMVKRIPTLSATIDQPIAVHSIVKAGKWSKRYFSLSNSKPSVRLHKSSKGGEFTTLCSLATFDVYFANAAHFNTLKPPKPALLVLKSTEPLRIFENVEDALQLLAFKDMETRDAAFSLLQRRRTALLRNQDEAQARSLITSSKEPAQRLLSFDVNPDMTDASQPPRGSDAAFQSGGLIARARSLSKPPPASDSLKRSRSLSRPPVPDLQRSATSKPSRPPVPDMPLPTPEDPAFTGGGLLGRSPNPADESGRRLERSFTGSNYKSQRSADLHRSHTTTAPQSRR